MTKIYLAGPLFTTAERDFNAELARLLRLYEPFYTVFLPQEAEQQDATPRAIFERDMGGIDWADVIVACMDGPDPDSGTCWECGAVYRRKPVILYRTDIRGADQVGDPYNIMLTQSAAVVLDCQWFSTAGVAEKIRAALESIQ